jgi:hypothetical protein
VVACAEIPATKAPCPIPSSPPALSDIPDRDTILSLSGLDFMQRVVDGTLPQAPIARTMNFRLAEVAHGRAVFHGAPLFDHMNPMGGSMAAGTAHFSTAAWAAR